MTDATEKQIKFADSLGIADAKSKSKETLKVLIDEKLKEKGGNEKKGSENASMGQIGTTEGISKVEHYFQSSYEFGKAGNRHTIKYWNVEDLKEKMKQLEKDGLLDEDVKVEYVK